MWLGSPGGFGGGYGSTAGGGGSSLSRMRFSRRMRGDSGEAVVVDDAAQRPDQFVTLIVGQVEPGHAREYEPKLNPGRIGDHRRISSMPIAATASIPTDITVPTAATASTKLASASANFTGRSVVHSL